MESNTVNPMRAGDARQVLAFLMVATQIDLTDAQRDLAESIIFSLGNKATVLGFVEAASATPELEQFATKVGAFLLPGEGYAELYKREYGSLEA